MGKATDDVQGIEKIGEAREKIVAELRKAIVGMDDVIDEMMIAIFAQGHVLLVGVPGLAKTLLVSTLAKTLSLSFKRIQFTPDLMPSDITGTELLQEDPETHQRKFKFLEGPVFTNLLLADEINRAPAKVQSALLEAMQESRVTLGDQTYELPDPFLVMATQNPIEQEGTYPLPEAQIDRFMLKCVITHPSRDDERRIMNRFTRKQTFDVKPVMSAEQIFTLRKVLDQVYCDEKVGNYILDIVFATRNPALFNLDIAHQIEYGASPRATLYLNLAARANAMLNGRAYATPQDVKEIAHDVLRHRVILTYEAEAEEVTSEDIVTTLLNEIPVP